jgi:hypothetical protein
MRSRSPTTKIFKQDRLSRGFSRLFRGANWIVPVTQAFRCFIARAFGLRAQVEAMIRRQQGTPAAAEPFAHAIKIFATCGVLRNGEDFSSFL